MSQPLKMILAAVAALLIAIAMFAAFRQAPSGMQKPAATWRTPRYWYDPMRPSEHFDKPGKSPFMDMQLVPKYADPASGAENLGHSIAVDPRIVETLGVRLAAVEQGSVARNVDTVGIVAVDEHRIEAIQVRQAGWVERLEVRAAGDAVRRGQLLAEIYSPDLLATQQELLIAQGAHDPQLIEAARRRLALFGLAAAQIARIEKAGQVERRVQYYAPFDGYVMELGIREGAAVQPGATLFQLADLSTVWMIAEVPEAQAAWVKAGDEVQMQVPALPAEHLAGRVDYLYPQLMQATRTLQLRVVIDNPRKRLRPGMFATAQLHGGVQRQVLAIPTEAVIKTGTRSVVIVADDAGHFRPVLVGVGAEHGGRSEILEGLEAGQMVVASGQFLIDSEANLRDAFDSLAGSAEAKSGDTGLMMMPTPAATLKDEVH